MKLLFSSPNGRSLLKGWIAIGFLGLLPCLAESRAAEEPRGLLFRDDFEAAANVSPYTIQEQRDNTTLATDSDPNNPILGTWFTYGGESPDGLIGVQVTSKVEPTFEGSYQGNNVLRIFRGPVGSGSAAAADFIKQQIGGVVRAEWKMMFHRGNNQYETMIHFSGTPHPGGEGFDNARITLAVHPDGSIQAYQGGWQSVPGVQGTVDKWEDWALEVDLDREVATLTVAGVTSPEIQFNVKGNTAQSLIFRGGGSGNDLFYVDDIRIYPLTSPIGVTHTPVQAERVDGNAVITYNLIDGFIEDQVLEVDPATIQLTVNDQAVTPVISKPAGSDTTTVVYDPTPDFAPDSTFNVKITFKDKSTPANEITDEFSFSTLPALGTNPPKEQDPGPDGLIVFEAENYDRRVPSLETELHDAMNWELVSEPAGFSGAGAMQALPDVTSTPGTPEANFNDAIAVRNSPRMDFKVHFTRTGTHYIWVRGFGPTGASDSLHVGLDGQFITSSDRITGFPNTGWTWSNNTIDSAPASFVVPTIGNHIVTVWMRENGVAADKFLITTSPTYVPTGTGPAESPDAAGRNYWRFEEASGPALDSEGDRPGTLLGGATRSTTVFGPNVPAGGAANTKSIDLSGAAGDVVDMGATGLDVGNGPFTVEAWINVRSAPAGQLAVAGKWVAGTSGNRGYLLSVRPGAAFKAAFDVCNGSGACAGVTSGDLQTGQWYHIAGVRDGSQIKIYVNGALAGSTADTTTGTSLDTTQRFAVGGAQPSGSQTWQMGFNGYIDEVRLTRKALGDTELLSAPPSTRPVVTGNTPGRGANNVAPDTNISITIQDGTLQVREGSIQMTLNGQAVAPVITKDNGVTTVLYDPPTDLAPSTTYNVSLTFKDTGSEPNDGSYQFSFTTRDVVISRPIYWRFEETSGEARDTEGANPGQFIGGATRSEDVPVATIPQTGQANTKSVETDGQGAPGEFGSGVNFGRGIQVGESNFTLEAYFKVRSAGRAAIIAGKLLTGLFSDRGFLLQHSPASGEGKFSVNFAMTGGNSLSSPATLELNKWYHAAGVRQGNTMRLFVDGVEVGSRTIVETTNFNSDQSFGVGGGPSGGVSNYDGWVDEVRLSNRALAPGELLNSVPVPIVGHGYWRFEEASGDAVDADGQYPGSLKGGAKRSTTVFGPAVPSTGAPNTQSLETTASGDAVDMGVTGLDISSGNFTLEAWFNARTATGGGAPLFIAGKRISGLFGDKGYELLGRQSGTGLTVEMTIRGPGGTASVVSDPLEVGKWYHVAAVRNGTTLSLYINGELKKSTTDAAVGQEVISNQHFSVGGAIQGDGSFQIPFDGFIDEVRLSDKALAPREFLNRVPSNYWRFEEADGPALDTDGLFPGTFHGGAARSSTVFGATVPLTGAANTKSVDVTGNNGDAVDFGAAGLDVSAANFTLEGWINVRAISGDAGFIMGKRISGLFGDKGYEVLALSSGSGYALQFSVRNGGPTSTVAHGVLEFNTWYHIAAARNGNTLNLYVNGELVKSLTESNVGITIVSPQAFTVGGARQGDGTLQMALNGHVDEVRLTRAALDPSQFLMPVETEEATITVTRSGNQLTISWDASGFVLQENSNIQDPNGWTDVANGGTSPVQITITGDRKFYRLIKR